MRKTLKILILLISTAASAYGQSILTIENQNLVYDWSLTFNGYYITHTTPTNLTFRNNYLSSTNPTHYMLMAGDEGTGAYNNNLDEAIVRNNYLDWNGTLAYGIITHGIFTGYNVDNLIRYNYLDNVPMGIIRKSNGMTDTYGVIAYNIIKNGAPGVVVKGMKGVRLYNNTFFSNHTTATCNRAMVEIYYNFEEGVSATSTNAKIKNNIFYSQESGIRFISIDSYSSAGFECDYNIYWVENSVNHEPTFVYHGSIYTWSQWRALGYDAHSVIIDPDFISTISLIPQTRLNYGVNLNLGVLVSHALDYTTTWSTESVDGVPAYRAQDSQWQVGAYALATEPGSDGDYYISTTGNDSNPGTITLPWRNLSKLESVTLQPGNIVYIRGGTYRTTKSSSTSTHVLWNGFNGTSNNLIKIWAYPGEYPVLNMDNVTTTVSTSAFALTNSSYVHVKGLRITGFAQPNASISLVNVYLANVTNSTIENFRADHSGMYGFAFGNGCDTINVINCDADHLADISEGGANGFNITGGSTATNIFFEGCRAWSNSDDGWDFYSVNGYVTFDDCWSFWNGYRANGTEYINGDGMGFKVGPTNTDVTAARIVMRNNLAVGNKEIGFCQNTVTTYNPVILYNNVSYSNGSTGYMFGWGPAGGTSSIFRNNISYLDVATYAVEAVDVHDHNSWNGGVTVSAADFTSLDTTGLDGSRQIDGSLPILNFARLVSSSDLIDNGVDVGLSFVGVAPDIGMYEYGVVIPDPNPDPDPPDPEVPDGVGPIFVDKYGVLLKSSAGRPLIKN